MLSLQCIDSLIHLFLLFIHSFVSVYLFLPLTNIYLHPCDRFFLLWASASKTEAVAHPSLLGYLAMSGNILVIKTGEHIDK